jgi:hypothetical protein
MPPTCKGTSIPVLAAVVALVICGCSGNGVGKVTGSVTLDGKPVADAEVAFSPKDDPKLAGSSAKTRADGSFELPPDPRSGRMLEAGNYLVLITKFVQKNGSVPSAEDAGMLLAAGALKNSLPAEYGEAQKSPFKIEIKRGANALPPFELKSRR